MPPYPQSFIDEYDFKSDQSSSGSGAVETKVLYELCQCHAASSGVFPGFATLMAISAHSRPPGYATTGGEASSPQLFELHRGAVLAAHLCELCLPRVQGMTPLTQAKD